MSLEALRELVTPAALRRLAGDAAFERGVCYHGEERVSALTLTANQVAARVTGTEPYQVRLWDSGDGLEFDCTCPQGVGLRFCKHCVAVALAWSPAAPAEVVSSPAIAVLPRDDAPSTASSMISVGASDRDRVRAHLEGLTQRELVSLLMKEAGRDPALRRRLKLQVAGPAPIDIAPGSV